MLSIRGDNMNSVFKTTNTAERTFMITKMYMTTVVKIWGYITGIGLIGIVFWPMYHLSPIAHDLNLHVHSLVFLNIKKKENLHHYCTSRK